LIWRHHSQLIINEPQIIDGWSELKARGRSKKDEENGRERETGWYVVPSDDDKTTQT